MRVQDNRQQDMVIVERRTQRHQLQLEPVVDALKS